MFVVDEKRNWPKEMIQVYKLVLPKEIQLPVKQLILTSTKLKNKSGMNRGYMPEVKDWMLLRLSFRRLQLTLLKFLILTFSPPEKISKLGWTPKMLSSPSRRFRTMKIRGKRKSLDSPKKKSCPFWIFMVLTWSMLMEPSQDCI